MRYTFLKRRRRLLTVAAVVVFVVVAGGVATLLLRGRGPHRPPARNVSRNYRACLLVPPAGTVGPVDAVWKGLQEAAATGRVNAQRYPVPSTDIPAALPYVNGAVAQHCDVLVAAGPSLVPVLRVVVDSARNQPILLVNGDGLAAGNVTVLSVASPDAVTVQTRSWVLGRAGH